MFKGEEGRVVEPPAVSYLRKTQMRCGVATEKVPQLVEEIEINPLAADWLAPEFRFLATKDYWRNQAMLTVPFKNGARGRMTPAYWNRAVPVAYGRIPFGQLVGGVVMVKGVFRSGGDYADLSGRSNASYPIGFFGTKDALKEEIISNVLLLSGFRSALPLARIVLNSNRSREFLLNSWLGWGIADDIIRCFAYLNENGDLPVIFSRLTGVMGRRENELIVGKRYNPEVSWAAQLFLEQAEIFPRYFEKYLAPAGLAMVVTKEVLLKVASFKKLTLKEFAVMAHLYQGITISNVEALKSRQMEVISSYSGLPYVLAAHKDNCLAAFTQDYEEARNRPEETGVKNNLAYFYNDCMSGLMSSWLERLEQCMVMV